MALGFHGRIRNVSKGSLYLHKPVLGEPKRVFPLVGCCFYVFMFSIVTQMLEIFGHVIFILSWVKQGSTTWAEYLLLKRKWQLGLNSLFLLSIFFDIKRRFCVKNTFYEP